MQGGSSITQQVAKLVWFDNTRTLERKIKEIPAALALEWKFSKNEILSIYLNRAYLGAAPPASRRPPSATSASRRPR